MSTSNPLGNASDLPSLLLFAEELDESKVTPGVLGFLVFAVMGLAVWWLMRSMSRRMDALNGKTFQAPRPARPTEEVQPRDADGEHEADDERPEDSPQAAGPKARD